VTRLLSPKGGNAKDGGYRSEVENARSLLNLLDPIPPIHISYSAGERGTRTPRLSGDLLFHERELKNVGEATSRLCPESFLEARGKTAARALLSREGPQGHHDGGLKVALLGSLLRKAPRIHTQGDTEGRHEALLRDVFEELREIRVVDIEADPLSF
jgi:hypothetical protein